MNAEASEPFAVCSDVTVACAVVARPFTCGASGASAAATVTAEALAGMEATADFAESTVLVSWLES